MAAVQVSSAPPLRKEGLDLRLQEFEEGYRRDFIQAFPDKHAADLVRVADGDWVAGAGYQDTTFANSWLGIPPTGEKIRIRYMDFWRIATDESTGERKLAENLVLIDILGVLEQAGYDLEKVLKFIGSKSPEFFENPPVAPPQPVHPWPELRGW